MRKDTTRMLSSLLEHFINSDDVRVYWAKEVTFQGDNNTHIRVDYMLYNPINNTISGLEQGTFSCYEIKSCKDDFHSPNGHNFIGDYNYYVMTKELYEEVKSEIPFNVGVYIPSNHSLKSIKKARKHNRTRASLEMMFCMWRSSRRELVKERGEEK